MAFAVLEVPCQAVRSRDDVGRAEERRGDPGDLLDLLDLPVGADSPRVAGEAAGALVEHRLQALRVLVP
jgi:hypothetical protein